MSLLNKKINRLSRLSDYRKVRSLTTRESVGNFEIEVCPKALQKLKERDKNIPFSFEIDFGIQEKSEKMYWVRVNNECPEKKTDFNYCASGCIHSRQHSGMDNWGVSIKFKHIDISCNWGQLNALCEMLAKWIDRKYGNDCGFEDKWRYDIMKIDFIENRK